MCKVFYKGLEQRPHSSSLVLCLAEKLFVGSHISKTEAEVIFPEAFLILCLSHSFHISVKI